MNNKQLYMISKYTNEEAFVLSQFGFGGNAQAQLIEKLEENSSYAKSTNTAVKIMFIFYLALLVVLPIQIFDYIQQALEMGFNTRGVIVIATLELALFFLLQFLMLTFFNIFMTSSVFYRELYEWLTTLPLSRDEVEKVVLYTLFRMIVHALIVSVILLPFGVGVITRSWGLILMSIGVAVANALFGFMVLVLLGSKLHRLMTSQDNDKHSGTLRVLFSSAYIVGLMVSVMGITFLPESLSPYYFTDLYSFWGINVDVWFSIFAVIPFPANPAFILVSTYVAEFTHSGSYLSAAQIGLSIVMGIIYVGIVLILYKKAKKRVSTISVTIYAEDVMGEPSSSSRISDPIFDPVSKIGVTIVTPKKAFVRKETKDATRDLTMITFFVIPFIYGFMAALLSLEGGGYPELSIIYAGIAVALLIAAVTRNDMDGGTVLASLPIVERNRVSAKIRWFPLILVPGFLLPMFLLAGRPEFGHYLLITALWLPTEIIFAVLLLLLKSRLFGKMPHKFVVDEVYKENKVAKWAVLIVAAVASSITLTVFNVYYFDTGDLAVYAGGSLAIMAGAGLLASYLYNVMFPKLNTN